MTYISFKDNYVLRVAEAELDVLKLDDAAVEKYCQGQMEADVSRDIDRELDPPTLLAACLDALAELRRPHPPADLTEGQQQRLSIVPTADGDPTWCGPVASFGIQGFAYQYPAEHKFPSHYTDNRAAIAPDAAALATTPGLPLSYRLYLDDVVVNATSEPGQPPVGFTDRLKTDDTAYFGAFGFGLHTQDVIERECPRTAAFVAEHATGPGVRLGGRGFKPYSPPPGVPPLTSLPRSGDQ